MLLRDLNKSGIGKVPDDVFDNRVKKHTLNSTMKTTSNNCLFCNIAKKELPAKIVFENEYVVAFEDIRPLSPVHIIIIPRIHLESINDVDAIKSKYMAKIFEAIPGIAKKANIFNDGYRVISNVGKNGGQTVDHLHFHILGGKKLDIKLV